MVQRTVKVRNDAGIHCRPSSSIIQKVLEFSECSCKIETKKGDADLISILGLLTLGLERGDEVTIIAVGSDEEKACKELAELFAYEFDFPLK